MALKHSSKTKSCVSLALNQQLEMVAPSDKSRWKTKVDQMLSLLHQMAGPVVKIQEKFLEEMECFPSEHTSGRLAALTI